MQSMVRWQHLTDGILAAARKLRLVDLQPVEKRKVCSLQAHHLHANSE